MTQVMPKLAGIRFKRHTTTLRLLLLHTDNQRQAICCNSCCAAAAVAKLMAHVATALKQLPSGQSPPPCPLVKTSMCTLLLQGCLHLPFST